MDLHDLKKIHFIGIGGVGVSSVARLLKFRGLEVSGSDGRESEIADMLRADGIRVDVPQAAGNVPTDADLVVYSVAVPEGNPERMVAKERGIEQVTYPQLLGAMISEKYGIGVSGTNGKTSTTAMIGKIFIDAGLDPTVTVGAKVSYLEGNSRLGQGKHFIFESDEYRRAFDNFSPRMAVNTYIGEDHFDCYKDLTDIKGAFADYFSRVPSDGFLILNADDSNSLDAASGCQAKAVTYGIDNEADFRAVNISVSDGKQEFMVVAEGGEHDFSLKVAGRFSVYNALAAIAAARQCGLDWEVIAKSLEGFAGAWRRMEALGDLSGSLVITDYAHTPDAVAKTIAAAKEFYPDKKLLAVFQPHQFSRTKNLFNEFAAAFNEADKALLSDIYYVQGRENPDDFDVDSKKLAQAAAGLGANIEYCGNLDQAEASIRELASEFGIILVMGAGDIYDMAKKLAN